MATYLELRELFTDSTLTNRVQTAVAIAAEEILTEADTAPNHSQRLQWAVQAIVNTRTVAQDALKLVLAANAGASVAQIHGATDAAIQSNVDAVIDEWAIAIVG